MRMAMRTRGWKSHDAIEGTKNSMSIRNDGRIINRHWRDDRRVENLARSPRKVGKTELAIARGIFRRIRETAKRLLKFFRQWWTQTRNRFYWRYICRRDCILLIKCHAGSYFTASHGITRDTSLEEEKEKGYRGWSCMFLHDDSFASYNSNGAAVIFVCKLSRSVTALFHEIASGRNFVSE